MTRSALGVLVAAAVLVAGFPSTTVAATEIQFWHAMTGVLDERVNEITAKFNASQSDYVVKAVNKGSYPETLNAAIAAYRAKQPPHVVQVFEVGTQTMLSSGAVYPVHQLMSDHKLAIDWNDLIGPVKSYYSTGGQLAFDTKQLSTQAGSVTITFENASPLEHNVTIAQVWADQEHRSQKPAETHARRRQLHRGDSPAAWTDDRDRKRSGL